MHRFSLFKIECYLEIGAGDHMRYNTTAIYFSYLSLKNQVRLLSKPTVTLHVDMNLLKYGN